jgi:hypothetical protein
LRKDTATRILDLSEEIPNGIGGIEFRGQGWPAVVVPPPVQPFHFPNVPSSYVERMRGGVKLVAATGTNAKHMATQRRLAEFKAAGDHEWEGFERGFGCSRRIAESPPSGRGIAE